jgi:hypothetical protein
MRTFAIASILLTTLVLGTDAAAAAPWCTEAVKGGGTNCGFYSFQQCMASASGNGGFCRQNQFENPYWTGSGPIVPHSNFGVAPRCLPELLA